MSAVNQQQSKIETTMGLPRRALWVVRYRIAHPRCRFPGPRVTMKTNWKSLACDSPNPSRMQNPRCMDMDQQAHPRRLKIPRPFEAVCDELQSPRLAFAGLIWKLSRQPKDHRARLLLLATDRSHFPPLNLTNSHPRSIVTRVRTALPCLVPEAPFQTQIPRSHHLTQKT